MVDIKTLKEANLYFWIVKGHLIPESWSDEDIMKVYVGYFARMWGNHESNIHSEGFEEAWAARTSKAQ